MLPFLDPIDTVIKLLYAYQSSQVEARTGCCNTRFEGDDALIVKGVEMDDPLILEVLDRLDRARVSGAVENLVLGALLGRMDEVVDGVRVERPTAAGGEEGTPVRAYLESVAVAGFRGIGPNCELRLQAGPGLTLVVGRNGSGKSSFAEGGRVCPHG